jgi:hypothetical protein
MIKHGFLLDLFLDGIGASLGKNLSRPKMYEDELLEAIIKAKTIIIVCGAGISVSAGFPSFVDPKTGRYLPGKKDIMDANVTNYQNVGKLAADFLEMNKASVGEKSYGINLRIHHNSPIFQEIAS